VTDLERRCCRLVLDTCLPGADGLAPLDLQAFWRRFDAAAPQHLRLGLRLATWFFTLGPLLLLCPPLPTMSPAARDRALQRLARLPGGTALAELVRLVACWALFQDAGVQDRVRGR